jgi:hypothetical protein
VAIIKLSSFSLFFLYTKLHPGGVERPGGMPNNL